jgi:hypothetical protein
VLLLALFFERGWYYMIKTNHSGALAATAGTLVAVGLLMLMMLVVEVRPAEAVDGGGTFNVTNNTTNELELSYSPDGEKGRAERVAQPATS